MSTNYIIEIQEDQDGELFIELPDDLIEELGWEEGDVLSWDVQGEGIVLSKINDESRYEVIEE
jgi:bifunctional DNA-binding transcriptional regulator/antitoxin component of YhaV-PrlF toxin-antitoxin module